MHLIHTLKTFTNVLVAGYNSLVETFYPIKKQIVPKQKIFHLTPVVYPPPPSAEDQHQQQAIYAKVDVLLDALATASTSERIAIEAELSALDKQLTKLNVEQPSLYEIKKLDLCLADLVITNTPSAISETMAHHYRGNANLLPLLATKIEDSLIPGKNTSIQAIEREICSQVKKLGQLHLDRHLKIEHHRHMAGLPPAFDVVNEQHHRRISSSCKIR